MVKFTDCSVVKYSSRLRIQMLDLAYPGFVCRDVEDSFKLVEEIATNDNF